MKTLLLTLLLLFATSVWAAGTPSESPKAPTSNLSTNIIGSNEAPSVLNVVPWQPQPITMDKLKPTSRLLGQVLKPIDKNVLNREIHYYQLLNKDTTSNGMFLSN